jgi:LmbE family N-acetylglucosaminyl deacetylase
MIVVVSPHLDDGVLACGGLLSERPGAVVITALAGNPGRWDRVTPWDASCGFKDGDDVIAARKREDREALDTLDATPVWLDFVDSQYGASPSVRDLAAALDQEIRRLSPDIVLVPLGLFHGDHRLVSDSGLALVRERGGPEFLAYEDALYRTLPGLTALSLQRIRDQGIHVTDPPSGLPGTAACNEKKRRAVHCYRSQLRGLAAPGRLGHEDAFSPERFWRLTP